MQHTEIVGYAVDGEMYCAEHAPEDQSSPIYAGDETWNERDCAECRTEAKPIPAGARVRCEYRGTHEGTLLALDDPRAWRGSLAFPRGEPSQDACTLHVRSCQLRGLLLDDKRPVLWDFPRPGQLCEKVVHWDRNLVRVARPVYTRGFTPREVIDCHAREHCGDADYPMTLRASRERWAIGVVGYHCDGAGQVAIPCDELADALVALNDLEQRDNGPIGDAAGDLRSSILDTLEIEEV